VSAALVATLVVGGAIGALAFARLTRPPARAPLTHFTIGPPFMTGSWPRVSPDGRLVVFGAMVEGRNRLWVRALDDVNGRALMNTTATETPFWSPDSRSLGFFDDGKLKRIDVESDSAQPEVLTDAPQPHGGDWHGQSILFSRTGGIYRVALDGSRAVTQLTHVDEAQGEYQHTWPEFLPDGRQFLFLIRSSHADRSGVYVASIDGGTPHRVMPAFSRVRHVTDISCSSGRGYCWRSDSTAGPAPSKASRCRSPIESNTTRGVMRRSMSRTPASSSTDSPREKSRRD
jgi:Tol biopolymer transport system component